MYYIIIIIHICQIYAHRYQFNNNKNKMEKFELKMKKKTILEVDNKYILKIIHYVKNIIEKNKEKDFYIKTDIDYDNNDDDIFTSNILIILIILILTIVKILIILYYFFKNLLIFIYHNILLSSSIIIILYISYYNIWNKLFYYFYKKYKEKYNTLLSKKKKRDNKNKEIECIICLENKAIHALIPCGHHCFCNNCVIQFYRLKNCPICRTIIKGKFKIKQKKKKQILQ